LPDSTPEADITRSIELVNRAQDGDDEALNQLFDRYYERVRRIVRLRLGRKLRSALDSGDILQETFTQAVQGFDGFEMRDEASLIHWLSKLAERQIIAAADYHGAKKRDKSREVRLRGPASQDGTPASGASFGLAADATAPLQKLTENEQVDIVERCIRDLPEDYRELIILRDYAGASWESVAEQTGRPSAAAARMMHARALIDLGKLVREQGLV
jgi:RNA polymerase sigma-70 factor (ECF subfamily)